MSDQPNRVRAAFASLGKTPMWVRFGAAILVVAALLGIRLYGQVAARPAPPNQASATPTGPFAEVASLTIGSCLIVQHPEDDTSVATTVDCDDPHLPSYTVVDTITTGMCEDSYLTQTFTDAGKKFRYCLMENFVVGQCYTELTGMDQGYTPVACTRQAKFEVVDRIEGVADPKACTADQATVLYPRSPQRTYCLSAPG